MRQFVCYQDDFLAFLGTDGLKPTLPAVLEGQGDLDNTLGPEDVLS
ncbi:MAG: hypothetical protein P8168_06200 [Deltaproteobacteria bacterium]|jgi:hypothetical protein